MKISRNCTVGAFTTAETLMALGLGSLIMAAVTTTSISLQKSLSAVDNYFSTHNQQIRIIDYLGRDVRRSTIVNTSSDLQTVNCYIPNYVIKTGDPDATGSNIGTRRAPTITSSGNKFIVNYGTVDYTQTPPTGVSKVVYSVTGQSILRTENNAVTMIASSTNQLVPQTTDVQQSNTEYAATVVTFLPSFVFGPSPTPIPSPAPADWRRDGTTVHSIAYLRNLRRGN